MRYASLVFSVGMLSGSLVCVGQQEMTKPVLSAQQPAQAAGSAPGAAAAAAATDGATTDPTRYVIGPDDQMYISVWKEGNLSGEVLVRPDGMISLPLVGDVQAAGLTPMQLSVELTNRFKKFIADPVISATVVKVMSKRVFLVGEVGHVGPMPISPDMTILQVLAAAGGPSPYANTKKIYILRGPAGHQTKIMFNYQKAFKTGDMQGVFVLPGDTIVVP